MCAPPTRKHHFFFTFSSVSRFGHTFFCQKPFIFTGSLSSFRWKNPFKCIIHCSLLKKRSDFVRAWWLRCTSLPRKIDTFLFFLLFQMYHAFGTLFWQLCCCKAIGYSKVLKIQGVVFDNLCKQQIYTISEKFEFDRIPEATKRKSTKAYVRRCMYVYLPHIYILT